MSEPNREPIPLKEPILVKRYSVAARVHHWFTALTAILLALSGFAFFHPSLFFLTDLFGGPTWTRIIHPWIGVIMTLSFLDLFVRFWRVQHLASRRLGVDQEPLAGRPPRGAAARAAPLQRRPEGDVLGDDDHHLRMFLSGIVLWQSQFGGVFSTGRCGSRRSCTRPRPCSWSST